MLPKTSTAISMALVKEIKATYIVERGKNVARFPVVHSFGGNMVLFVIKVTTPHSQHLPDVPASTAGVFA